MIGSLGPTDANIYIIIYIVVKQWGPIVQQRELFSISYNKP